LHVGLGLEETRLCNGKTFGVRCVSLEQEREVAGGLQRRSTLGTYSLLDLQ
jgi:hypothetical protein